MAMDLLRLQVEMFPDITSLRLPLFSNAQASVTVTITHYNKLLLLLT